MWTEILGYQMEELLVSYLFIGYSMVIYSKNI